MSYTNVMAAWEGLPVIGDDTIRIVKTRDPRPAAGLQDMKVHIYLTTHRRAVLRLAQGVELQAARDGSLMVVDDITGAVLAELGLEASGDGTSTPGTCDLA